MDVPRHLGEAVRLHRAGRLGEAAALYKAVLRAVPDHADALNLLGAILLAKGDAEGAIALTRRASAAAPEDVAPYVNLGNALQAAGRLDEAAEAFERASSLSPVTAEAGANLASVLNALGRHREAAAAARRALAVQPAMAVAYVNLGNALLALDDADGAVAAYTAGLERTLGSAACHYNLGNALARRRDHEAALGHFRRAVEIAPARAEHHYNLANAALALEGYDEAIAAFRRAIAIESGYTDAHNNLGSALQSRGRLGESITSFRRAVALQPDRADAHWNLALALLQDGAFEEGWREYEWRWRNPDFTTPARDFGKPLWDGRPLDGKTILLYAEQGMGDTLQFVRYVPEVVALGGRVVVECQPPLVRLVETVAGIDHAVAGGDPLPDFQVHAPLLSLPRILGTTLESVPDRVPYLSAPHPGPIGIAGDALNVGFAWAGSSSRRNDARRSVAPGRFRPLFGVPGVEFFSLQVGARAGEIDTIADAPNVHPLPMQVSDFAATAAIVDALDLVISVDTAVVHLAGALAKPVWVLLPYARPYLWLTDRADSPWYPRARLFAQSRPGDWEPVFEEAAAALAKLAGPSALGTPRPRT